MADVQTGGMADAAGSIDMEAIGGESGFVFRADFSSSSALEKRKFHRCWRPFLLL